MKEIIGRLWLVIGGGLMVWSYMYDFAANCSTEIETDVTFVFGNACQDAAFGSQLMWAFLALVFIVVGWSLASTRQTSTERKYEPQPND